MNDIELARTTFQSNAYAFVLVKDARVVATGTREGIGELLDVVAEHGATLRGAALADKIVGKAVAMVAAYAGITNVYTPLGSQAAQKVLADYGIPFQADYLVPLIRNKRNDGPCPMERLTQPLDEPAEAVKALGEFVAARRAGVPLAVG
jgi:hypothetical protein